MKILDNRQKRVSGSSGVCPLYAIVADDYSRMYNVLNLKDYDLYKYRSYAVNGDKYLRLKELPILAENFDDLPSLLNKYPELFV